MSRDKLKRYIVFAGNIYYPRGGMYDYLDTFDLLEDAEKYCAERFEKTLSQWFDIFDMDKFETVSAGSTDSNSDGIDWGVYER